MRLGAERRQAERLGAGTEIFLRTRLEDQDRQRRAALGGMTRGFRDQSLMAQMHAVEISDGDNGALVGVRHVGKMSENPH